jgi:hypothetical protein
MKNDIAQKLTTPLTETCVRKICANMMPMTQPDLHERLKVKFLEGGAGSFADKLRCHVGRLTVTTGTVAVGLD